MTYDAGSQTCFACSVGAARRVVAYNAASQTLRTGMLARKKVHDVRHDVALCSQVGSRVLRFAGTKKDRNAVHPNSYQCTS